MIFDKKVVKKYYYKEIGNLTTRLNIWEKYGSNKLSFNEWIIKKLLIDTIKKDNYLDVGCGIGNLMKLVYKKNKLINIYGVDLSLKMIKKSRKINQKFVKNIKQGDIESLPFSNENFYIITAIHVFHHIPNIKKALLEIKRVGKKGGTIFITASDYKLNQGLNKLHYDSLSELSFPKFMQEKKKYLHFNHQNAKFYIKNVFRGLKIFKYKNYLKFKSPRAVMDYYKSAMMYRNTNGPTDKRISEAQWQRLRNLVSLKINKIIQRKGYFSFGDMVYGYKIIK